VNQKIYYPKEMKTLIWIEGRGMGKARPRGSSRVTRKNGRNIAVTKFHTCSKYRQWTNDVIRQIAKQNTLKFTKPVSICCNFVNFKSSDTDNITGAILDALVKSKVIGNDSASYVVKSAGEFSKLRKIRNSPKQIGILVEIEEREIKELEPELANFIRGFGVSIG
jgi:Holliday junction resolvase RusA-like endonuclease